MQRNRLESFSDGVIAIVITIQVLELKVPAGTDWASLGPVLPTFLAYALSFVYIGIYWSNHHHMLHTLVHVNGAILWANLHLLFWLSLVPFATAWLGRAGLAPVPTAVYGALLLLASLAYHVLARTIIASRLDGSELAAAVGRDLKGKVSSLLYVLAIVLAVFNTWLSAAIYVLVALMWLVPDRRIESRISGRA